MHIVNMLIYNVLATTYVNMLMMCLPLSCADAWFQKKRKHQPGVEMTCTDDHTWMGEKIYRQWCIIVDRYWSRKSAVAFFHYCWLLYLHIFCPLTQLDKMHQHSFTVDALHVSNKEDLPANGKKIWLLLGSISATIMITNASYIYFGLLDRPKKLIKWARITFCVNNLGVEIN